MRRKPEDYIPPNILLAARRAGLGTPIWYCGRNWNPNHRQKKTLADLAEEVRNDESRPKDGSHRTVSGSV